jgi:hypothetical protein
MDDSLINLSEWKKARLAGSGQKVYQTVLNVAHLPPGNHDVRVEKLVVIENPFSEKMYIRQRKNWAKFTFIKTY